MPPKLADFLSSVGMMIIGVGLLFFSSVTFTSKPVQSFVKELPVSQVAPFRAGGDIQSATLPVSRPAVPIAKASVEYVATMTAKVAIAVDDISNTVLFKNNATEVRSLASITKLMSALVLVDLPINWASSTVISEEDTDTFSHHVYLGESYKLDDLWNVALVGSSNSAIKALVRAAGLTEEEFVDKMNHKARNLGLFSLRFTDPTGLDSRNMGTGLDVLKLLKFALKEPRISEALQISEYYGSPLNKKSKHRVWNTNWLLTNWIPNTFDKDVLVGKTGFIDQSGYNFVVRIPGPGSHAVRVVILGAVSNEARFIEARDLAEWVFENYLWPDDENYSQAAVQTN